MHKMLLSFLANQQRKARLKAGLLHMRRTAAYHSKASFSRLFNARPFDDMFNA